MTSLAPAPDKLPNVSATIAETASAIRIPGNGDSGSVLIRIHDDAAMLALAHRFRQKPLRVTFEVDE